MAARARSLGAGHEELSPLPWIAFDAGHRDSAWRRKGPGVGVCVGRPLLEVHCEATEGLFLVTDLYSLPLDLPDLSPRLQDRPRRPSRRRWRLTLFRSRGAALNYERRED